MSSYTTATVNPDTHEIEQAEWLDDYFGQHNYGVRFPSTGVVYRADEYEWHDDINMQAMRSIKHNGGVITRENTIVGKRIETHEHADGRKDVTVEVNTIDVEVKDAATAEAKRVIEEEILPAVAHAQILLTIIHKPTNESCSLICFRKNVRDYAMKVVAAREDQNLDHYCLVEHDGESVTVTTL